ncbi:hypothetical protein LPC08_22875 [Roseomonas sp. OT10]|uniref:hypothetical protein n=1 Tax=Roseomonas cutis TaxID=2897332 RepID=UPI001E34674C|nr:hypothetical protein [Roseomonas sp. OT10]UFN48811.1 hypothetical protein LPC08_22875 [Roseomonas sp. OT10]
MVALLPRRITLFALLAVVCGIHPAAAQGGGQNDPSFNLVNRTSDTIMEAYVSSAQVSTWGQDLLGNNVLNAGGSFPVRLPRGQCVNDIRVVYDGGRAEERRNINTCTLREVVFGQAAAGGGSSGKGGAQASRTGNPSFNLVNNTRSPILVVRASLSSDSSWGEDRLGNSTIAPGQTFAIRLPAGECDYDIRVEYEGGRAEERRNVDLCNVSTVTFP